MIVKIDIKQGKFNKEETELLTNLIDSEKLTLISWEEIFIEQEIEEKIDYDSSDFTPEEIKLAAEMFKQLLEDNLDNFINRDYIYFEWRAQLEKARNSLNCRRE